MDGGLAERRHRHCLLVRKWESALWRDGTDGWMDGMACHILFTEYKVAGWGTCVRGMDVMLCDGSLLSCSFCSSFPTFSGPLASRSLSLCGVSC